MRFAFGALDEVVGRVVTGRVGRVMCFTARIGSASLVFLAGDHFSMEAILKVTRMGCIKLCLD